MFERSLLTIARSHMATDFVLELVVESAEAARIGELLLNEGHRLLANIEDDLTEFRDTSPVHRLNRSQFGEWVAAPPSLLEVLTLTQVYFEQSGGAFSPFARSSVAATFDDLEIDPIGSRLRRRRPELRLGFGAIGKGYALDRVAARLDREGFTDYRLGAGGSSWVFRGFAADRAPWEISWGWAKDADGDWIGQRYRLPGGQPLAIGVSGTTEKGQHFFWDGAQMAVKIQSSFCSARSAAEADALSTALLVGSSGHGEGFLTRFATRGIAELGLAYVDLENQMIYNQVFEKLFLREGRIR